MLAREGYHPKCWREATTAVIPKPQKPDWAHRVRECGKGRWSPERWGSRRGAQDAAGAVVVRDSHPCCYETRKERPQQKHDGQLANKNGNYATNFITGKRGRSEVESGSHLLCRLIILM